LLATIDQCHEEALVLGKFHLFSQNLDFLKSDEFVGKSAICTNVLTNLFKGE
jgi:hypothetical protein